MLYVFAVATVLIFLAELGDKSQLLALGLAARYKPWQVLLGLLLSTLILQLLAVLAGGLIGNLIPAFWLSLISGLLFIGFGIWTLRSGEDTDTEDVSKTAKYGPIVTTFIAFFLAEFGDKTQIMAMTIAADPAVVLRTLGSAGPAIETWLAGVGLSASGITSTQAFWGVWIGATFGMMLADSIAIIIGAVMGKTLPERLITRISGTIFILFGVAAIVTAFLR